MNPFEGAIALIIEDDDLSVNVLQRLLNQLGVASVVLSDYGVQEKLPLVARPHVVFLDLEMPHISGYGVLDLIRQTPHLCDVPVVAYTTHLSHMNETHQAGFHSFLGKPLNNERFADQLSRILKGEQVWEDV
jgi:two-component system, cell cycle response regulator DivK